MTQQRQGATWLPHDAARAVLIGRLWLPNVGPVPVQLRGERLHDLSGLERTTSGLLDLEDVAEVVGKSAAPAVCGFEEAAANAVNRPEDETVPRLLAPCDLQAIKACGVTFVASMLERVIEERTRGDAASADEVRRALARVLGEGGISGVVPGSPEAAKIKQILIDQGWWSQYLEVGIGPYAEVFTKAQPMSAVGPGASVGLHPESEWNNPEPEIVLAVSSKGKIVGATLGNDVNLRDFEGRSALLLGKAKDNNASCAIGPFIRLFDAAFGLDDVRRCELSMRIAGADGFHLAATSAMSKISRDPEDLVAQTIGPTHQYPDGLMLFLGTMFAPTKDRGAAGQGFTHVVGDLVEIFTPQLGTLVNRVDRSDRVPPWNYGVRQLVESLLRR